MNELQYIVAALLATLATAFSLLAAVGILRMPDLYTRLHAAGKAATLGAICALLAGAVYAGETGVTVRVLMVIGFLLFTMPIATHRIARAGYLNEVRQEEGTVIDELKGKYDRKTGALASPRRLKTRCDR
ncbi:MAG: monovalent cation/H(+) antiporter subunit G [Planctomycetota bacterium]